ncbi:MAG: ABC transporter substrate-binding protein [Candidatus Rokubacteria bacterium]|nr:ABC transporter substrate-binding protein [Candidatus Rokubacteria bacterium]
MNGRKVGIVAVFIVFHLSLLSPALAAEPQDRVRATLDAVYAVLTDPQLQGPAKEVERRQRVQRIIRDTFDFAEMGRESLRTHWAGLTPQQREQFVTVFGAFFERSYDRLVLRFLRNRQAAYGAESVEKDRARVQTTLVDNKGEELPVDYHLKYDDQRWSISDVVVDGARLASSFRAQFDKIIRTSSYDTLLLRMKIKAEQN